MYTWLALGLIAALIFLLTRVGSKNVVIDDRPRGPRDESHQLCALLYEHGKTSAKLTSVQFEEFRKNNPRPGKGSNFSFVGKVRNVSRKTGSGYIILLEDIEHVFSEPKGVSFNHRYKVKREIETEQQSAASLDRGSLLWAQGILVLCDDRSDPDGGLVDYIVHLRLGPSAKWCLLSAP